MNLTVQQLRKIIEDHEERILRLENSANVTKSIVAKKGSIKSQEESDFVGPTGGVKFLISKGFFNQRRIFAEVKKELQSNNYNHSRQSINAALGVLSKRNGPLVTLKEGKRKEYADRK